MQIYDTFYYDCWVITCFHASLILIEPQNIFFGVIEIRESASIFVVVVVVVVIVVVVVVVVFVVDAAALIFITEKLLPNRR